MDTNTESTDQATILLWKASLRQSSFRRQFISSALAISITLIVFTRFLAWVEAREGVVLQDPILAMIEPRDFTWLTFGLIYAAVVIALTSLMREPQRLLLAIQAYTFMVIVRIVMMYLMPLNPPEGLIVLQDPLVQFVGDGNAPTKDLFFSGHTSTMFLLYLVARKRVLRNIFLGFTLFVAICVVWQHVHYVIDVAVAPFVAYAAYRAALAFQKT